jgi:hypothetical protein
MRSLISEAPVPRTLVWKRTATSVSDAIARYDWANHLAVVHEFCDEAVSGADPVVDRPGCGYQVACRAPVIGAECRPSKRRAMQIGHERSRMSWAIDSGLGGTSLWPLAHCGELHSVARKSFWAICRIPVSPFVAMVNAR